MPSIKLYVKPDNTFLTQLIYDGLLTLIHYNRVNTKFNTNTIEIPKDSLRKVFESIKQDKELVEKISEIRLRFVGNDKRHQIPSKILKSIGIIVSRDINTYGELLNIFLDNAKNIPDLDDLDLIYRISSKDSFIVGEKEEITAPQLFKIDRYTGFTSPDTKTTYQQYTLRTTSRWMLISLIGILSSYISSYRNEYYFVFLSPDDIIMLLARGDPNLVYNIMSIKNLLNKKLKDVLKTTIPEEIIVLSILFDLNIIKVITSYEIEHVSFQIYRIASEGNTFKIYSTIPITIYSNPYYLDILKESVKDYEKLVEELNNAFSGNGIIIQAIRSISSKNPYPEAEHVLSASYQLYKLITVGDINGLYSFLRELENACSILESRKDEKLKIRFKIYKRLLTTISKYI